VCKSHHPPSSQHRADKNELGNTQHRADTENGVGDTYTTAPLDDDAGIRDGRLMAWFGRQRLDSRAYGTRAPVRTYEQTSPGAKLTSSTSRAADEDHSEELNTRARYMDDIGARQASVDIQIVRQGAGATVPRCVDLLASPFLSASRSQK
jgi:hypothetical protein